MNTDQLIRRGKAAGLILADETIDEVFSSLGQEWMEMSYKAPTLEMREKARDKLIALDAIKSELETMVSNGRNAER